MSVKNKLCFAANKTETSEKPVSFGPFLAAPDPQPVVAVIERPSFRGGHQLGPDTPSSPILRHNKASKLGKGVRLHPDCAENMDPPDDRGAFCLCDQHSVAI